MSVLVVGDLHIKCWPQGIPTDYSPWESIFNQIHEILDQKTDITDIVFVGDIFENTNLALEDIQFFTKQTLELEKFATLHFIYGNHDYQSINYNNLMWFVWAKQAFNTFSNSYFYTEPTLVKLKIGYCSFLPWPHHVAHKKSKFVFAHITINNSLSDFNTKLKSDIKIDLTKKWIIGDLHTFQEGENFVYVGSPLQQKYGTTLSRYFLLLKKDTYSTIPISLPYKLQQITVTNTNKILAKLDKRKDNEYTKLKIASELYETDLISKLSKYPRLLIEPIGKRTAANDEPITLNIDSMHIRQSLVQENLKKLKKPLRKKAKKMIEKIEKEIRS